MGRKNDFNESVKRKAAEKVAYFCSNPDCKRFTLGPDDRGNPHHYGEAAHIYPASNDGPRYDSTIKDEFIKSESNCLWLCDCCHSLIDTNETLYSAKILLEWKKKAEARAFDIINNPIKANELILEIEQENDLASYFDELFQKGNFKKIAISIKELSKNNNLEDSKLEEISLAQTKFDAFCSRKKLDEDIKNLALCSEQIKERISDFAIFTFDAELCSKIIGFSNDNIKQNLVKQIADGTDIESIYKEHINDKYTKYLIIVGGFYNGKTFINNEKQRCSFRDGWLLEICDTILSYLHSALINQPISETSFDTINDKKDIFLWLDTNYIKVLIDSYLPFFPRCKKVEHFIKYLIDNGISTSQIRSIYFLSFLTNEETISQFDYAFQIALKSNDLELIALLFSLLQDTDPQKIIDYVDKNFNVLKNNLFIIDFYRVAKRNLEQHFDLIDYLDKIYSGEKDARYYLLKSFVFIEKQDNDSFIKYWNQYLNKKDYEDNLNYLAIDIAIDQHDEVYLKDISEKTNNPILLFKIANMVVFDFESLELFSILVKKLEGMKGRLPNNYNRLLCIFMYKLGRYKEALDYGVKVHNDENGKDFSRQIVQLKIINNQLEEDQILLDIASTTTDGYTLFMLGNFYISKKDNEKGWGFIARSVVVENSIDKSKFIGKFLECNNFDEKLETDKYSYVVCEDGYSFILVPLLEKKYYKNFKDIDIYYIEENSQLCFLNAGDVIALNNKDYKINKIYNYLYYFYSLVFKRLATDESTITIKASDTNSFIKQISSLLRDSKEQTENFIASTNGQPLPFFMFEKAFGKGIFAAIEALYYSNKRKSYCLIQDGSAQKMPKQFKKYLLDIESVYLLFKLGISPKAIEEANCCISCLTKSILLNELNQRENEFRNSSEKGVLQYTEGKPVFIERTNEDRRRCLNDIQNIKKLIDVCEVVTPKIDKITKEQNEILLKLKSEGDECDSEMLVALWSGCVLVSNNSFFYLAKNLGNGTVVDLSSFILFLNCSSIELVKIAKHLKETNIPQYVTPYIFSKILDKYNELKDEIIKKEALDEILSFINGDWDSNWTNEEKTMHEYVIYLGSTLERTKTRAQNEIGVTLKEIESKIVVNFLSNKSNYSGEK